MKATIKKSFYVNQDLINALIVEHFKKLKIEVKSIQYDMSETKGLHGATIFMKDEEFDTGI
jgi:hypothetical protein